ncbi:MAG: hypothetical protein BJ554DRAFT_3110 [Olpidium bornovanus]|uniref:HTH cro/C1-type domain-containing protein n=1 Tax=Olpidium bornovanus TaxID=278681 RepID=A0A8H7ZPY9_9FUNG|nr:MAG: hypothetical protein BJ554DRAFT_3110 [Olpidium bornovanus]
MSNVGWDDQTVLRKRPEQIRVTKSQAAINAARRAGAVVETDRKSACRAHSPHFRRPPPRAWPRAMPPGRGKKTFFDGSEKRPVPLSGGAPAKERSTLLVFCCSFLGGPSRVPDSDDERIARRYRPPAHREAGQTDDVVVVPKVSLDVGKAMMRARMEKQLTQKEVGEKINEKANVINDYEAGRAVPNQQILAKLERALGVKLRGKDIGMPLEKRGAKK